MITRGPIDANTGRAGGVVVVLLVGEQFFTSRCNIVDGEFNLAGKLPFHTQVPLEGLRVDQVVAGQFLGYSTLK